MRVCPHCGYENDDTSDICIHCDQALPLAAAPESPDTSEQPPADESVPPTPIPLPGAASAASDKEGKEALSFLLGAGLGLIPAIIFAIGTVNSWGFFGCFLFPFVLIFMGIFLSQKAFRPLGYGLLAAALISPIVVAISCSAAPLKL